MFLFTGVQAHQTFWARKRAPLGPICPRTADAEFATVVKDWLTAAKCADLSEDSRFKDAKGKDDHEDPPWISTA